MGLGQDVMEQTMGPRDFVVMASDGLWDVLTNHEVRDHPGYQVRDSYACPQDVCDLYQGNQKS